MNAYLELFPPGGLKALQALWGQQVRGATLLRGGRNSRVLAVEGERGGRAAAKFLFRHPADPRDRLGNETAALKLMRSAGIEDIPELLGEDSASGLLLLGYIEGEKASAAVRREDIPAMVGFLGQLLELSGKNGISVGLASEACFSLGKLSDNLRLRLQRLDAAHSVGLGCEFSSMRKFLGGHLVPALNSLDRSLLPPSAEELERERQFLSPSDFGFHNAIRLADGRLVFHDFEYFGWDDPAKLVCDLALHPGMGIDQSLQVELSKRVLAMFSARDREVVGRVRRAWDYFVLKWCAILLNEFLRQEADRRSFSGNQPNLSDQLGKSMAMFGRLGEGPSIGV